MEPRPPRRFTQGHAPCRPNEVGRLDRRGVQQREHGRVGDQRTELLHQVEDRVSGESTRAVWPIGSDAPNPAFASPARWRYHSCQIAGGRE